ncbi:TOBE domain-containing protein [Bradyrhizobium sp. U531]
MILQRERVFSHSDRGRLAVRPEYIRLEAHDDSNATVLESAYTGTNQTVLVRIGGLRLTARTPAVPGLPLFQSGQHVRVSIDTAHTRVFAAEP